VRFELDSTGAMQLTNLSHVGIAVKSAEETVKWMSSVWNIGSPSIDMDYWPKGEDITVGEPFGVRLVWVNFGPLTFELLEPLDDKSIWATFIAEKGEGIHHVAFGVSNYDEMVKEMLAQGQKCLVDAVFEGCRWCYFEIEPGGTVIEFREEYLRR
jgi:catechol 2,3-dioxygenase-like lactoylglutathione lyase family enzyme